MWGPMLVKIDSAHRQLSVNVVDVREVGPRRRYAEPIHWRLLTNHPIPDGH